MAHFNKLHRGNSASPRWQTMEWTSSWRPWSASCPQKRCACPTTPRMTPLSLSCPLTCNQYRDAGQQARQQQREEELESIQAIFGSDAEQVDMEGTVVLRFLVFREETPSQPGAPLEELHISFLLTEEYPAFPLVFELQGRVLSFQDADALYFSLLSAACNNAGEAVVFLLVNQAREMAASLYNARHVSQHQVVAARRKDTAANTDDDDDDDDDDDHLQHDGLVSLVDLATYHMGNPSFFFERPVSSVIDEILRHTTGMRVVRIENVLRPGVCRI